MMPAAVSLLVAAVATVTPTSTFPQGPISPRTSHEIVKLNAAASELAGKPATVNCWSRADWRRMVVEQVRSGYARLAEAAAFTNIDRAQIQMGPDSCETLAKILAGRPAPELDTAIAVGLVAHEARHAAGVQNEAAAECGGMRTIPQTAELLGIPAEQGMRLQHVYRGTVYPLDAPEYRSASCRAGLPGISVPNEFGPDENVARLRAYVRRIGGAIAWSRLPAPPAGQLSPCSPIKTRTKEIARVEQLYRKHGVFADVAAAELRTEDELQRAFARTKRAFGCFAREDLKQLRKLDRKATISTAALSSPDPARALGTRTIMRSKALGRSRVVVQDLLVAIDPSRRFYVAVVFRSTGPLPPAAAEARAIRVAVR